jgi:hypothetical protein
MAGPEVPFPLIVRYTSRLDRMPPEQRPNAIAKAKERLKRKGRQSKRDQVFSTFVGNG